MSPERSTRRDAGQLRLRVGDAQRDVPDGQQRDRPGHQVPSPAGAGRGGRRWPARGPSPIPGWRPRRARPGPSAHGPRACPRPAGRPAGTAFGRSARDCSDLYRLSSKTVPRTARPRRCRHSAMPSSSDGSVLQHRAEDDVLLVPADQQGGHAEDPPVRPAAVLVEHGGPGCLVGEHLVGVAGVDADVRERLPGQLGHVRQRPSVSQCRAPRGGSLPHAGAERRRRSRRWPAARARSRRASATRSAGPYSAS